MDYQVTNDVVDAQDQKWLDVTYTAKKYLTDSAPAQPKKGKKMFKFTKKLVAFCALGIACLGVLLGFTFIDGNFDGNFLQIAKATVTTAVFGANNPISSTYKVPFNMQVTHVDNGIVTLSGGKALTSLTVGTVTAVEENCITISVDDNVSVVYSQVTDCFVTVGDVVQENQLIARYEGQVLASVCYQGNVVVDVVATSNTIKWSI